MPEPLFDPRATADTKTGNRGTTGAPRDVDPNVEFLGQLGLHPATGGKRSRGTDIPLSFHDAPDASPLRLKGAATAAPANPPVSDETRKEVERARRSGPPRAPRGTTERLQQAAVDQGVPYEVFHRPLTDFEVLLRSEKQVQVVDASTGVASERFLTSRFEPLADPDTGEVIGYAGPGADLMIVDLQGKVRYRSDAPVSASAVQADDLLLVGGVLRKAGSLAIKGGLKLAAAAGARYIPGKVLVPLRAYAAAARIGLARPTASAGRELAERAAITTERRAAARAADAPSAAGGGPRGGTGLKDSDLLKELERRRVAFRSIQLPAQRAAAADRRLSSAVRDLKTKQQAKTLEASAARAAGDIEAGKRAILQARKAAEAQDAYMQVKRNLKKVWDGLQDPKSITDVVKEIRGEADRLRQLGRAVLDDGVETAEAQAVINLSRRSGRVVTVPETLPSGEFFIKYATSRSRLFDPRAPDVREHGATTHLIQDLILDRTLRKAGSRLRAEEFRHLLGRGDEAAEAALGKVPGRTNLGIQLWEEILHDTGFRELTHSPETLFPLLQQALPGLY